MQAGRIVKVQLPGHLVSAMDGFINGSADYSGRDEVLADALAAFLSEAGVSAPEQMTLPMIASITPKTMPGSLRGVEPLEAVIAATTLEIHAAPEGTSIIETVEGLPREQFTWGLHNRDFPTVWAAFHLGAATAAEGGPVPFLEWQTRLARTAWQISLGLQGDSTFDLSGFPINAQKATKAEARFLSFFVGAADGTGPIFDLALAGIDTAGCCALTAPGVQVLRALEGWDNRVDVPQTAARCGAWLMHLAQWAPADIDMFITVIDAIGKGRANREDVLLDIAEHYQEWSESQVSTNTAAAVARLRELGLLERRQREGRYVVAGSKGWAASQLDAILSKKEKSA